MDQLRSELTGHEAPAGRRAGRRLGALLIAALAGASACGAGAPAGAYTELRPTREAAAQAVADGLAASDMTRLAELAVTAAEFRRNIWPALPASDPEVGMAADYVWADTHVKSRGQLASTLDEHGGRRLTVESVRFGGPPTDYDGFRLHRKTWVTVRDEQGRRRDVRLFGSMIETAGGWKVYSYIVD